MASKPSNITHQLNKNSYTSNKSILQQIQYLLVSNVIGKYANSLYINEFINFLVLHIFSHNISTQNENRFNQLNIPMLYLIFIIKTYLFPNITENDIVNETYKNSIEELLKTIIQSYNHCYEDYYLVIVKYLSIYELIYNNKFFNL